MTIADWIFAKTHRNTGPFDDWDIPSDYEAQLCRARGKLQHAQAEVKRLEAKDPERNKPC